jgi:hypothetical protein
VRSPFDLDDADGTEPTLKDIAISVRVGHNALPGEHRDDEQTAAVSNQAAAP